jgi:DNA-binding MarR family transcriptional regulator
LALTATADGFDVDELCASLFGFVRDFGLHRPDETPCGIPMSVSEAQALTALIDGPAAPSELADRLVLARSTVSRLLENLSRQGWILRRHDPDDGRSSQVLLSASGRRMAERVLTARHERLKRLMANIEASARPDVVRALRLLAEAARDD